MLRHTLQPNKPVIRRKKTACSRSKPKTSEDQNLTNVKRIFACNLCDYQTYRSSYMEQHMVQMHAKRTVAESCEDNDSEMSEPVGNTQAEKTALKASHKESEATSSKQVTMPINTAPSQAQLPSIAVAQPSMKIIGLLVTSESEACKPAEIAYVEYPEASPAKQVTTPKKRPRSQAQLQSRAVPQPGMKIKKPRVDSDSLNISKTMKNTAKKVGKQTASKTSTEELVIIYACFLCKFRANCKSSLDEHKAKMHGKPRQGALAKKGTTVNVAPAKKGSSVNVAPAQKRSSAHVAPAKKRSPVNVAPAQNGGSVNVAPDKKGCSVNVAPADKAGSVDVAPADKGNPSNEKGNSANVAFNF